MEGRELVRVGLHGVVDFFGCVHEGREGRGAGEMAREGCAANVLLA